jgi:hypothetical protein
MLLGRGVPKGTLVGISPFFTAPSSPVGSEEAAPAAAPEAPRAVEVPAPVAAPVPEPAQPAPAAPAGLPRSTLLGVPVPQPPAAAPAAPNRHGQTILGMPAVVPQAPPAPEISAPGYAHAPPSQAEPSSPVSSLPGYPYPQYENSEYPYPYPGDAQNPPYTYEQQPAPFSSEPTDSAPALGAPPTEPSPGGPMTRTILGVARPGIAPLDPSQKKESPSPPASPYVYSPQLDPTATAVPTPPAGYAPPEYAAPGYAPPPYAEAPAPAGRPRGIPVLAALAVTLAAALFAAGVVVLVLHRGTGPIEGRAVLGADGKERLELSCAECPDGTRIGLGKASTTLEAKRGTLALPAPLKIGENKLRLLLTRPGEKKSTEVSLTVPVQYRVRADTSTLADPKPRLRVLVDALPKSVVTVAGVAIKLGSDGKGSHDVDISAEITGADPSVRKLERVLDYSVTPPDGAPEAGKVTFQLGVTPLTIEAPRERITIDTPTFVLSGKSQKGASVSVADRPIQLDAEGRFAQVMSVSSEGETTISVRATSPDQAPRLYAIQIKRVARLADEAARLRPLSIDSYAQLSDADAHRGEEVALDGALLELRAEGYASYLLVDVASGCKTPPCLLRVLHGAPVRVAQGSPLAVFGRVTGSVDGARSGTRIPEVVASFLIPGTK